MCTGYAATGEEDPGPAPETEGRCALPDLGRRRRRCEIWDKGKFWKGLMERVTEEGGYPYLCCATPLGFQLLPPGRGGAPARTTLSIFVSPGPGPGETVKPGVPLGPVPGVL